MQASLFTLAGLCALACAFPEHVKRQSPSLASVLSQISSLQAELQPPPSILSELSGVPATVTAALNNPSLVSVLQSQINASGFPGWYSSLAPDAQSWVISVAGVAATVIPEIVSLEVAASLTTLAGGTGSATATTSSMTKSHSNSTMSTTSKATPTLTPTTKASSSPVPSKSSSAGAAPTNIAAAGILGAVGFLGLVVAL
ncbi:uncharacterized protein K444DRAFT_616951 [Hyaloscypha bicolor E]|uniref:Uncharacterized protein n=1 Tax=Hyaloscypha bicolor E TaxID=1095630 RepID=A0A2J6SYU4_9HELO|nr:uncharacterized protein K444DRAFT_616951 [Hyaloscypha bicolor E]PMD55873.1 hypothetical protein K444DRAFT_616951 [Hyaloscypha bicolor E]